MFVGVVFIWWWNMMVIWVIVMVGGLVDVGYFVFLDVLGYVNFVLGMVMILIFVLVIVFSFVVWLLVCGKIVGGSV